MYGLSVWEELPHLGRHSGPRGNSARFFTSGAQSGSDLSRSHSGILNS